jgi:predicted nucleic acid-binding protein
VTLLVDAAALLAQADRASAQQEATSAALRAERGPLVTSAFVAQEADYLILRRLGTKAELDYLQDLASGTFQVESLLPRDLGRARAIVERYGDLRLGLADASLVLLAERFKTRRILTFDERHFRAVEPLQGGHFTILPADG